MSEIKSIETIKQEISELLDQYYEAYEKQDFIKMKSLFLADETLIGIGTDQEEFWLGWDEIKDYLGKQMTTIKEIRFDVKTRRIKSSPGGDVAWFGETLTGRFKSKKETIELKIRMSGVAIQIGDQWKLTHFHRSVPIKDYAVKYEYPIKRVPVRF